MVSLLGDLASYIIVWTPGIPANPRPCGTVHEVEVFRLIGGLIQHAPCATSRDFKEIFHVGRLLALHVSELVLCWSAVTTFIFEASSDFGTS